MSGQLHETPRNRDMTNKEMYRSQPDNAAFKAEQDLADAHVIPEDDEAETKAGDKLAQTQKPGHFEELAKENGAAGGRRGTEVTKAKDSSPMGARTPAAKATNASKKATTVSPAPAKKGTTTPGRNTRK